MEFIEWIKQAMLLQKVKQAVVYECYTVNQAIPSLLSGCEQSFQLSSFLNLSLDDIACAEQP